MLRIVSFLAGILVLRDHTGGSRKYIASFEARFIFLELSTATVKLSSSLCQWFCMSWPFYYTTYIVQLSIQQTKQSCFKFECVLHFCQSYVSLCAMQINLHLSCTKKKYKAYMTLMLSLNYIRCYSSACTNNQDYTQGGFVLLQVQCGCICVNQSQNSFEFNWSSDATDLVQISALAEMRVILYTSVTLCNLILTNTRLSPQLHLSVFSLSQSNSQHVTKIPKKNWCKKYKNTTSLTHSLCHSPHGVTKIGQ